MLTKAFSAHSRVSGNSGPRTGPRLSAFALRATADWSSQPAEALCVGGSRGRAGLNCRVFAALIRPVLALAIAGAAAAPVLAQQVSAQQISAQQGLAQQVELEGPERGQLRALVIGIDAYKTVRPLLGAVADARDIEQALRHGGVGDVMTLVDDGATRDGVIA